MIPQSARMRGMAVEQCRRKGKEQTIVNKFAQLNSHNNFLLASGHLEPNLKGDSLIVEVPANYNTLNVVVLTPESSIKKSFSLQETEKRKFKDLRHAGIA